MDQDKSKYIKDTPYFSLVHFQYWSSSARCFAFREWQDSYGTCLLGSGFLRPTTGSKHSASIRVDRVDLYAGPTHSAVHRTQGHRNYRSLQKNNNPPLLFPSSRSCLFKSTHRNPVGSTRTRWGCHRAPCLWAPCLKPPALRCLRCLVSPFVLLVCRNII